MKKFGTIFISDNNPKAFYGYYSTIKAITPLLKSNKWNNLVEGWYINAVGYNMDSVRISYYSNKNISKLINKYISKNNLSLTSPLGKLKDVYVSSHYGGEELRFKKYLLNYSHIGMDLINDDLHYAQCLFSVFRWQIFIWGGNPASYFAPSFEKRSPYYRAMSGEDKKQFLRDLGCWPNYPQVDWAHMFVNMILGVDSFRIFKTGRLSVPLPIDKINDILNESHIFKIPKDWEPDN
jgi:hypothetical protein